MSMLVKQSDVKQIKTLMQECDAITRTCFVEEKRTK